MANAAVELLLKLKADTKGLNGLKTGINSTAKGLKGLSDNADKASASLQEIGSKGVDGLKDIAGAATIAGGAIAIFVQQVNSMNTELRRNATLAGTSLETFQAFANFGEQAGVSIEHTADAMNDLNLKITEAAELGSGAAVDVFKKLGLDPEELSKIQDSGEQMIVFLEKLNKANENTKRLFSDELASDAFIFYQKAASEVDNFRESIEAASEGQEIITQDQSDRLAAFNTQMVELQQLIKKVGVQAVLSFEDELNGAVNSSIETLNKFSKALDDPFSNTSQTLQAFKGVFSTAINGVKLIKDNADLMWYTIAGEDGKEGFERNLKEMDESFKGFTNSIGDVFYGPAQIVKEQIAEANKELENFDVNKLIDEGKTEEEIRKIWEDVAKESLKGMSDFQNIILQSPDIIAKGLRESTNELLENVNNTNDEINVALESADFKIKVGIEGEDGQDLPTLVISEADKAIKKAAAQLSFIELQFKSGSIDLETYKELSAEQIKISEEAAQKAVDASVGIEQIGYKKKLEEYKIYTKKIDTQQDTTNKAQEKANAEILAQNVKILENKGKYIEALREQKIAEQDAVLKDTGLDVGQQADKILNIEELYGFKEAEIQANELVDKIKNNLESLEGSTGAERTSILGNLDSDIASVKVLKEEYGGLSVDVIAFEKERNTLLEANKISEEEIKAASDLVLASKIKVLQSQGKITEAAKLQLDATIDEINNNKTLTEEQSKQLASDAILLANARLKAAEASKQQQATSLITSSQLAVLSAQGKSLEVTKLQLQLDIQRINANKILTADMKEQLISDKIKIANLNQEKEIQADLEANNAILAQKELELLTIQGQKSLALQKQFEITENQINANSQLTDTTKAQVIAIEEQKLAYANARIEATALEESAKRTLEQMQTAETIEEYNKLALALQIPIDKLKEMEETYPGLQTKSEEFTKSAIEGTERLTTSVEEAANFYADTFVSALDGVIQGTMTVEDAFKNMLYSIAQELLKSNISKLLTDLFSSGGSASGGGSIFSSIAGLFLHNGGVVGGASGFTKNVGFDSSMLPRYHTGGIAGLKPNEVNAVLEKGEEVITADDSRHVNNGGKASNNVNIINEMNTEDSMKNLGSTRSFSKSVRNEILSNPNEYKAILS